ncbi:MAG TPA: PIN domain-containing protein, partial [Bacilli bacterium]
MKKIAQLALAFLGALGGWRLYAFIEDKLAELTGTSLIRGAGFAVGALSALAVFLASARILDWIGAAILRFERKIGQLPLFDLLSGLMGLVLGLVVSVLVYPPLSVLDEPLNMLPVAVTIVLSAVGFRLGLSKKEETAAFFLRRTGKAADDGENARSDYKILDTSVIIDGRIADICKTGFIEGTLIIPEFVLEELQHIADSSDLLKRNRGRRGLDILNKIQKELDVKVLIHEGDFEDISEVDSKLVKLAKVLGGKVLTNDYNLNKVCELQGVSVLNINDLANAVKPIVLPGEEIVVQVIKDGKEHGQGVAYLDDGT